MLAVATMTVVTAQEILVEKPSTVVPEETPDFLKEMQADITKSAEKVKQLAAQVQADQTQVAAPKAVKTQPPPQEVMVSESSESSAEAQMAAQARAKAHYDTAMAHMKAMSDKLGNMEEDYEQRAKEAGRKEEQEGRKEQLMAAASLVPELASTMMDEAEVTPAAPVVTMETSQSMHTMTAQQAKDTARLLGTDKEVDPLVEAMKHKEVNTLRTQLDAEHEKLRADSNPMAALIHERAKRKAAKSKMVANHMKWVALQDGWEGDPEAPSLSEVHTQALTIETNLEAQGTKLSKTQKDQIEEATRVHAMNEAKIDMTQQRIKAMRDLVDEDTREARKEQATSQAEQLYYEQDATLADVESVKAEAKSALNEQEQATAMTYGGDSSGLVEALDDIQTAAKAYDKAEAAAEALPAQ
jgi:hypothetical protein